jgi:hypothetical protein
MPIVGAVPFHLFVLLGLSSVSIRRDVAAKADEAAGTNNDRDQWNCAQAIHKVPPIALPFLLPILDSINLTCIREGIVLMEIEANWNVNTKAL